MREPAPTSVGGLPVLDAWSATGVRYEYAVVRHPESGPIVYQHSGAQWERVHASHANNLARRINELSASLESSQLRLKELESPPKKKRGRPRKQPQEVSQ